MPRTRLTPLQKIVKLILAILILWSCQIFALYPILIGRVDLLVETMLVGSIAQVVFAATLCLIFQLGLVKNVAVAIGNTLQFVVLAMSNMFYPAIACYLILWNIDIDKGHIYEPRFSLMIVLTGIGIYIATQTNYGDNPFLPFFRRR